MRSVWLYVGMLLTAAGAACDASADGTTTRVAIQVRETAGIRRFGYPVTVRISLPARALSDPSHARLLLLADAGQAQGKVIPAQFSAIARHPDGTVRTLDVDFNLSPGPLGVTKLQVEYGDEVIRSEPKSGLTFADSSDSFQVGAYKVRKDGNPLLSSVRYGREYLKPGGLSVVMWDGDVQRTLADAKLDWTVEKQGPFQVTLRCEGRWKAVGGGPELPLAMKLEFVSSKSWVGVTQTVQADAAQQDAASKRRFRPGLVADFALSGRLLWDEDVGYWLYGVLEPAEQIVFVQNGQGWRCLLGNAGQELTYATSTSENRRALGWGHFQEARENGNVIAMGIGDFGRQGEHSVTLGGDGKLQIRFTPDAFGKAGLRTFFHFIPVPTQHTARTSPAAMMTPLEVTYPIEN